MRYTVSEVSGSRRGVAEQVTHPGYERYVVV